MASLNLQQVELGQGHSILGHFISDAAAAKIGDNNGENFIFSFVLRVGESLAQNLLFRRKVWWRLGNVVGHRKVWNVNNH